MYLVMKHRRDERRTPPDRILLPESSVLDERDGAEPEGVREEVLSAIARAAEGPNSSMGPPGAVPDSGTPDDLAPIAEIWRLSAPPEGPDAWPAIASRIREDRARVLDAPKDARRWWRAPATARIAAALLVCLGAAWIVQYLETRFSRGTPTLVSVPAAAMDTVELPGGVVVFLNSVTTLGYATGGETVREVTLDGEAYFQIPHDPDREFVVRTAAGEIRDLGTEFNVHARSGSVRVVVAEGEIELSSGDREVTVEQGHESIALRGRPPSESRPAPVGAARAWLQRDLVVIDRPLAEVAAEIERRYGVAVRVAPALQARRITASLRDPSAADAIRALCVAVSATCHAVDGGWSISLPEAKRALHRTGR